MLPEDKDRPIFEVVQYQSLRHSSIRRRDWVNGSSRTVSSPTRSPASRRSSPRPRSAAARSCPRARSRLSRNEVRRIANVDNDDRGAREPPAKRADDDEPSHLDLRLRGGRPRRGLAREVAPLLPSRRTPASATSSPATSGRCTTAAFNSWPRPRRAGRLGGAVSKAGRDAGMGLMVFLASRRGSGLRPVQE